MAVCVLGATGWHSRAVRVGTWACGLMRGRVLRETGTRTHPPSVTEVIAVLNMDAATSRTAAQATHPLSIRVRLPSGSNYL